MGERKQERLRREIGRGLGVRRGIVRTVRKVAERGKHQRSGYLIILVTTLHAFEIFWKK